MLRKADCPALITGMMATLAGIGIARFAYTSLLPELVLQQWFTESEAAYLGAANLLGYLIGALIAHRLSERFSMRSLLLASFIAIAASFFFCGQPRVFEWFFIWRLISGVAGAILMIIGPAAALSHTPINRRSSVGAYIFMGIGLGAVLSATVIPLLIETSLQATWFTLAFMTILAGFVCDRGVVNLSLDKLDTPVHSSTFSRTFATKIILLCVMVAYALDAVGFVPHTVFWVDFLAREKAFGIQAASAQWVIFGIGAVSGPFFVSFLVKRIGWHYSLVTALVAKSIAVSLPLFSTGFVYQTLSSFTVGAMIPGVVALTSGRIAELVGPLDYKKYWGLATLVFALAQAISGYAMSMLYDNLGSYFSLFNIGCFVLMVAAFLIMVSECLGKRNSQSIQ